jgi:hypothetical protein
VSLGISSNGGCWLLHSDKINSVNDALTFERRRDGRAETVVEVFSTGEGYYRTSTGRCWISHAFESRSALLIRAEVAERS